MPTTLLVIPCYNEAERLPVDRFIDFAGAHPEVTFLFVDDGSTDRTRPVLEDLANRHPGSFRVMSLDRNRGKGEAVRAGMQAAVTGEADYIGYWDADLSTPLDEVTRFIRLYEQMPDRVMLSGARVKLMGQTIERRAARHYLGRVFATVSSILLDVHMYDTQCGAKLFRRTPELAALFEEPFRSRWLFDLELILRIRKRSPDLGSAIYEVTLTTWRDVPGSRISYAYFFWAAFDLLALRLRA